MKFRRLFVVRPWWLACVLVLALPGNGKGRTPPLQPSSALLLDTMQAELSRSMKVLAGSNPSPYFMSYSALDQRLDMITGQQGALFDPVSRHVRSVDVSIRVGSHQMDNTRSDRRASGLGSVLLPVEDDRDAIARALWLVTDRQYKQAARAFLEVQSDVAVRAEEDPSPDFTQEKPRVYLGEAHPHPQLDRRLWEERIQRLSRLFLQYPEVYGSVVTLMVDTSTRYFVSSEGSRILTSRPLVRLVLYAETRSEDGMDLLRSETFDASSLDGLPDEAAITRALHSMATDLVKLRKAPVVEPYAGPALLSGRAAAVFFHEVLGHRLEGQRQRGDEEGQTFAKKVNQQILPPFLSVVDDPTLRRLNGVELNGYYEFDEEGVPGQRAEVVRDGILKNFLMSRLPVQGFVESNGHGRAQPGLMPVGRQGNLIVSSTRKVPDEQLRELLIEEVRRQGKSYGLYFEDIAGGFTLTTRYLPQAFQILPVMVWRVFPDGRPDELVRGVDIVGTPLTSLNRLMLTGEKVDVFNGICGAESGSVPVAAAAPAILFSEIEVQKKPVTRNRPPILPPPAAEAGQKTSPVAKESR